MFSRMEDWHIPSCSIEFEGQASLSSGFWSACSILLDVSAEAAVISEIVIMRCIFDSGWLKVRIVVY